MYVFAGYITNVLERERQGKELSVMSVSQSIPLLFSTNVREWS